jgi:hypothetical protein
MLSALSRLIDGNLVDRSGGAKWKIRASAVVANGRLSLGLIGRTGRFGLKLNDFYVISREF